MTDVHDVATRSRNMAAIRGRDTKPELQVRGGLHRLGFRYRLHSKSLPGRPDLVFSKYRAAVFVHGCYWHGHDCKLFRWPATRKRFWQEKIRANQERDARVQRELHSAGWRTLVVWECALRGVDENVVMRRIREAAGWLEEPKRITGAIRGS